MNFEEDDYGERIYYSLEYVQKLAGQFADHMIDSGGRWSDVDFGGILSRGAKALFLDVGYGREALGMKLMADRLGLRLGDSQLTMAEPGLVNEPEMVEVLKVISSKHYIDYNRQYPSNLLNGSRRYGLITWINMYPDKLNQINIQSRLRLCSKYLLRGGVAILSQLEKGEDVVQRWDAAINNTYNEVRGTRFNEIGIFGCTGAIIRK